MKLLLITARAEFGKEVKQILKNAPTKINLIKLSGLECCFLISINLVLSVYISYTKLSFILL